MSPPSPGGLSSRLGGCLRVETQQDGCSPQVGPAPRAPPGLLKQRDRGGAGRSPIVKRNFLLCFQITSDLEKRCKNRTEIPFLQFPQMLLSPWNVSWSAVQTLGASGRCGAWTGLMAAPPSGDRTPFLTCPPASWGRGVCAPLFLELRVPVFRPESGLALVSAGCPWACPRGETPSLCGVGGSLHSAHLPALGNIPSGPLVFLRLQVQQALWREQAWH